MSVFASICKLVFRCSYCSEISISRARACQKIHLNEKLFNEHPQYLMNVLFRRYKGQTAYKTFFKIRNTIQRQD